MNEKLIKIQKQLKAPKSNTNSFGGYKYRSAEDILEAVKPLVHAQGLTLTLTDEVVNIGHANYVKATARLTGTESNIKPDGVFAATAYAREAETKKGMDEAQITGSASSYARKYALNGLFAIDDTKDPDTQDNSQHVAKKVVDPFVKAKNDLNKMLELYQHETPEAKQKVIDTVLGKSTVTTKREADEVMQALEDGTV